MDLNFDLPAFAAFVHFLRHVSSQNKPRSKPRQLLFLCHNHRLRKHTWQRRTGPKYPTRGVIPEIKIVQAILVMMRSPGSFQFDLGWQALPREERFLRAVRVQFRGRRAAVPGILASHHYNVHSKPTPRSLGTLIRPNGPSSAPNRPQCP